MEFSVFIILFLVSIPIFYIYGIISFIRNFITNGKKETEPNPNTTSINTAPEIKANIINPTSSMPETSSYLAPEKLEEENRENFLEVWYHNNSINLLLYIGAFLIVTASAIFVGFQWDAINGFVKTSLLVLLTLAFFGFGWWFYSIPKVQNAGATFIAIAAILIPVIGAACYNFILRDYGVAIGVVWLFFSVISLFTYLCLVFYFKKTFYAYASTIGTFSLTLSFVSTFNLERDFYLLAGIIACFILLLVSQLLKRASKAAFPLSTASVLSSEIGMPVSVGGGLLLALSQNRLFTMEVTLGALLAGLFYITFYLLKRDPWRLMVGQILLLAAVYLGVHWLQFLPSFQFYTLMIVAIIYCAFGAYLSRINLSVEEDISLAVSGLTAVWVFLAAWFQGLEPVLLGVFSLIPLVISLVTFYLKKKLLLLCETAILAAIFFYFLDAQILTISNFKDLLSISYLILGVIVYLFTCLYKDKINVPIVGLTIVSFYCLLSYLFGINNQYLLIVLSFTIAILLFFSRIIFQIPWTVYGATFFFWSGLIMSLQELHIPVSYYPLVSTFYSYVLFYIHRFIPWNLRSEFRTTALLTGILTMFGFEIESQFVSNSFLKSAEYYGINETVLFEAYAVTALFYIDYFLNRIKNFGYATSFVTLCTILWQIHYVGFTDILMYTFPIGLYGLGLGYKRYEVHDLENEKILNILGLLFLLVPPFLFSFGDNAVKYSLVLGIEGVIVMMSGITLSRKIFRYAGLTALILAILPQTYSYIYSLPRWVVVGILGFSFLLFALFLLVRRDDKSIKN